MPFKLRMMVDVCMTKLYAHALSDDLDLDFENVCKANPTCFSSATNPEGDNSPWDDRIDATNHDCKREHVEII